MHRSIVWPAAALTHGQPGRGPSISDQARGKDRPHRGTRALLHRGYKHQSRPVHGTRRSAYARVAVTGDEAAREGRPRCADLSRSRCEPTSRTALLDSRTGSHPQRRQATVATLLLRGCGQPKPKSAGAFPGGDEIGCAYARELGSCDGDSRPRVAARPPARLSTRNGRGGARARAARPCRRNADGRRTPRRPRFGATPTLVRSERHIAGERPRRAHSCCHGRRAPRGRPR